MSARHVVICLCLWAVPQASQAQAPDPDQATTILSSVLPLSDLQVSTLSSHHVTVDRVALADISGIWRSGAFSVARAEISRSEGGYMISLDRFQTGFTEPEAPVITVTGDFRISDLPGFEQSADPFCRAVSLLHGADVRLLDIAWPEENPRSRAARHVAASRLAIRDMLYQGDPDPGSCLFRGQINAGPASLNIGSTFMLDLSRASMSGVLPLDLETARDMTGPMRLAAEMAEFEIGDSREVPQIGISDLQLSIEGRARDAIGLVLAARNATDPGQERSSERVLLELWNGFHLLSPDISMSLRGTRFFLPGIIPTNLHANFRRAGLTNLYGDMELRLDLEGGEGRASADMKLTGIADLSAGMELRTRPVPSALIREVMTRGSGIADQELMRFESFALDFADKGLWRVSMDMFGIPSARLMEEIHGLLALSPATSVFLKDMVGQTAQILRRAGDGGGFAFSASERGEGVSAPATISLWLSGGSAPSDKIVTRLSH